MTTDSSNTAPSTDPETKRVARLEVLAATRAFLMNDDHLSELIVAETHHPREALRAAIAFAYSLLLTMPTEQRSTVLDEMTARAIGDG